MTAQEPDLVELGGATYDLLPGSALLYDPRAELGVEPIMRSTALRRGYHCVYAVADARLILTALTLTLEAVAVPRMAELSVAYLGRGAEVPREGEMRYTDLTTPVQASGELLLGSGFLEQYYEHGGLAPAWKYETVLAVTVEDGVVTSVTDRSADNADKREAALHGVEAAREMAGERRPGRHRAAPPGAGRNPN